VAGAVHRASRRVRVATRYRRRSTDRSSIRGPGYACRSGTPLSRLQPLSIQGQAQRRWQGETSVFPFYAEHVSEAVAVIGRTLRDLHRSSETRLERRWRRNPPVTLVSSAAGVGPGTSGKDFEHISIGSRGTELPFLRFLNGQDLIDGDVFQYLPNAARPEDFDPLNCPGLAQAEMKADIVAAEITGDVVDLFDLLSF